MLVNVFTTVSSARENALVVSPTKIEGLPEIRIMCGQVADNVCIYLSPEAAVEHAKRILEVAEPLLGAKS